MEDFGSFIIILIGAISAIVSAAQKNKKKAAASRPLVSAARPPQTAAAAPKKAVQPAPAAAPVSMASMLPREEAPQPMQPQVHTHLDPDCETHDAPASGSLNYVSSEGKDPCHEEQLTYDREMQAGDDAQPGLTFDWSGDAMVKAFVMQEVLARPCSRRTR